MVTKAEVSSAAAEGVGTAMATRAADLSDEALKMVFRLLDGGDPGQKSREDLVGWLASKPDNEATNTAIEIVEK